jgi:glucoamylase
LPGTWCWPNFKSGAFDLTRFQMIDAGDTIYLRATLRDLTPTFGSALGAQLLDLYISDPSHGPHSSAARFPSRNYTMAPDSAWSRLIEVQGFADPVLRADGAGAPVRPVCAGRHVADLQHRPR